MPCSCNMWPCITLWVPLDVLHPQIDPAAKLSSGAEQAVRVQIGALLGGVSTKNAPQLQNLAMELRKVCCHPVR